MTLYRLTSTHTFNANTLEEERFSTAAGAWLAAGVDYLSTDAGITDRHLNIDARKLHAMTGPGSCTLISGEVITVEEVPTDEREDYCADCNDAPCTCETEKS